MKSHLQHLFRLPALLLSLVSLTAGSLYAQTISNLHNFADGPADGRSTFASITLVDGTLYGTTTSGGSSGNGILFSLQTNGTGFVNLHNFSPIEGSHPRADLLFSGNKLFGTALLGGNAGSGTIFSVNTNGTGLSVLHHFKAFAEAPNSSPTNSDGIAPSGLIVKGNTLYGWAIEGGHFGGGTIFKLNTNGSAFEVLHTFATLSNGSLTNSEGISPFSLVLAGNTLYGVANRGGTAGNGALFAVQTDGTGFTNLHNFTRTTSSPSFLMSTNSDGERPASQLVRSGNTLLGTAAEGGRFGAGAIFAINTDGAGFTNLHNFAAVGRPPGPQTNSDGFFPNKLVLSGNTVFGTTLNGGPAQRGTIFAIKFDGTGFVTLLHFPAAASPANTNSTGFNSYGLSIFENTLYGTALNGGSFGFGTAYRLDLPPPPLVVITRLSTSVVVQWPTNSSGLTFTLQSSTNLVAPPNWTTVSPSPVLVSGQSTVTNPIAGAQKVYRLSQ